MRFVLLTYASLLNRLRESSTVTDPGAVLVTPLEGTIGWDRTHTTEFDTPRPSEQLRARSAPSSSAEKGNESNAAVQPCAGIRGLADFDLRSVKTRNFSPHRRVSRPQRHSAVFRANLRYMLTDELRSVAQSVLLGVRDVRAAFIAKTMRTEDILDAFGTLQSRVHQLLNYLRDHPSDLPDLDLVNPDLIPGMFQMLKGVLKLPVSKIPGIETACTAITGSLLEMQKIRAQGKYRTASSHG